VSSLFPGLYLSLHDFNNKGGHLRRQIVRIHRFSSFLFRLTMHEQLLSSVIERKVDGGEMKQDDTNYLMSI